VSLSRVKERNPSAVAVLDEVDDQTLSVVLDGSGVNIRSYTSLEEVREALVSGEHVVAALAINALRPDAHRLVAELRRTARNARLVIAHRGANRPRVVDRLWSEGACHSVLSTSAPAERIRAVFQSAMTDALFERISEQASDSMPEPRNLHQLVQFLQRLAIALAGQGSTAGLLRELSVRLPEIVSCSMFGVLLLEHTPARLVTFQATAVDHALLWKLAESACDAIAPFRVGAPILPGELDFHHGSWSYGAGGPLGAHQMQPEALEALAWPMVVSGTVVGSLAIVVPKDDPARRDNLYAIQLIASQLGTSLNHTRLMSQVETSSRIDALTGLPNRQYMPELLEREWRRAQRYSLQLSVVLIDLDGFGRINQIHGQSAGDRVLKRFAQLLTGHVRNTDNLIRYGGDRFLLLLPETGVTGATKTVERIRIALKAEPIKLESTTSIILSISAGISSHPAARVDAASDLLVRAETALADIKKAGGNRTGVADAPPLSTGSSPGRSAELRNKPRVTLEVPTTFLPLPELDLSRVLRLPSINVSTDGIALRDPTQQLKRNNFGLVFFDDIPDPMLCQVVWVRSSEGECRAGLRSIRSSELLANSEKSVRRPRRALIAIKDEAHRKVIQRVLRSARYDVRMLDVGGDDLNEKLLQSSSLVIMSTGTLAMAFGQRLLKMRQNAKSRVRVIVLNENLDRDSALDVISMSRVEHLISGEQRQGEVLFTTLTKLVQQDFFGIRRHLLPGADCKRWSVTNRTEKSYALSGVRTVAEEVGCHAGIMDLFITAVDEMIISMLYGTQMDQNASGMKPISVECGSDGRFLCVGVLDEYGLLGTQDIYANLAIAAEHRLNQVQEEASSPYLGFRILLEVLSEVSINVQDNRTEIIGVVDLRRSLREHRASALSLGVFVPD
jgi:diguanylate cyclase (GGDEF)-like protein